MKKIGILLAIIFAVSVLTPAAILAEETGSVQRYYVSINGNDSNPGTESAPFATITAARDSIRSNPLRGQSRIEVIFDSGHYYINDAISFDESDSGAKDAPVVYKARDGAEVYIDGGTPIAKSILKPVTDEETLERIQPQVRDKVKVIDVKDLGLDSIAPHEMMDNRYTPKNAPVKLFEGDKDLTLARFPNIGEPLLRTGKVVETGSNYELGDLDQRPGAFIYLDDRIESWKNIEDVWMWGQWYWAWAPSTTNIGRLDTENDVLYTGLWSSWGYQGNKPYYYYNVLEELDIPGEYYMDRENNKIYVYPETDTDDFYLTKHEDTMVKTDGTSHIRFENLTFQGTRGACFDIVGGEDVRVDGCTIRYIGKKGMWVRSGKDHKIINNEMYLLGSGGIDIGAEVGDKATLTSGNTVIENNHIHDFSTWVTSYSEAISLDGVGNSARYNTIHGADHMSAEINGIMSIFEYNEIYNVVRDTDDAGAVYMFTRGDSRGCHIRYNYFHGVSKRSEKTSTGTWTVYFDGFNSAKETYGNIFKDVTGGIHINGGNLHNIYSNLFIDVDTPMWLHFVNSVGNEAFWKPLDELPYNEGIWAETFPTASIRVQDAERTYFGNKEYNNIAYDCGKSYLEDPHGLNDLEEIKCFDASDDIFVDIDHNDWTFKTDPGVPGFYVPCVDEIGLRQERIVYE